MKWLIGIAVVLTLLLVGVYVNQTYIANPRVTADLLEDPEGAEAQRVTLITLPDGRTLPVNYLREGEQVFMGADGPWWRQFRDGARPVTLVIQGETLTGQARAVLDDPEYTADAFSRLRPAVPDWLPDWLNGVLVVVELDP